MRKRRVKFDSGKLSRCVVVIGGAMILALVMLLEAAILPRYGWSFTISSEEIQTNFPRDICYVKYG
jgi:hypothetical protein